MKVVYNPVALLPVASASSTAAGTSANNAIDGNTNNYWESNSENNPWLQVDLTKILRVYQIDIYFDSVNAPTTFKIQTSDNTSDNNYGQDTGPWDAIVTTTAPVSGKNSYVLTPRAYDFRYLRIYMTAPSPGKMRIKEIVVWASSNLESTTSRIRIAPNNATPTYITPQTHDFMEAILHEGPISDKINQIDFKLNNKNEKYLQSNYPMGSPVSFWIDGVLKLFGILTLFTPHFDSGGFVVDAQAKDYGDYLINNTVRMGWASLTPFDSTQTDDIIATGPNSILALVTNSVGTRLFPGTATGYTNLSSTLSSPNFIPYFKAKNKEPWTLLRDLRAQSIDGAWGVQNGAFNKTQTLSTAISLPNTISDGYWYIHNVSLSSVGASDSLIGNVASVGTVFAKSVPSSNGFITQLGNEMSGIYGTYFNLELMSTVGTAAYRPYPYYDGGTTAESQYVFSELVQPVLFLVSQISNTTNSLIVTEQLTPISSTFNTGGASTDGGGFWNFQGIADVIVEGVAKNGQIRRLHYVVGKIDPTAENDPDDAQAAYEDSGGILHFYNFPDKLTPTGHDSQDGYISVGTQADTGGTIHKLIDWNTGPITWGRNLYSDWLSKFGGSSTTDTITSIKAKIIPFLDSKLTYSWTPGSIGNTAQLVSGLVITQLNVVLNSSVKNPPQQFDFFASSVSSSGTTVPDLQWFAIPRIGVDTNRNLNDSNTVRFYTDFPRTDTNNIISFDLMSDPYKVKNEVVIVGTPVKPPTGGYSINARDPNYLLGFPPFHGSNTPKVDVSSVTNMTTLGRRRIGRDITGTISEAARDAITTLNSSLSTPNRVTIRTKGNANLTPGQVVYLDSSYVSPKGFWYIVSAVHMWRSEGYETEITASTDKLRFSTELVRLQQQVHSSALSDSSSSQWGLSSTKKPQIITYRKIGADLNNVESLGGNPEGSPNGGQPSLRFPYNLIPEFSHIKEVTVTNTRLLSQLQNGQNVSGTTKLTADGNSDGWDVTNKINYTAAGGTFNVNDGNFFAQRFVFTSQSAGRIRLSFNGYTSNQTFNAGATLFATLWTDTDSASSGPIPNNFWAISSPDALYDIGGAILGAANVKVPHHPAIKGPSIVIPFGSLPISSNSYQCGVEFDVTNAPLLPGQYFWIAFGTQSAGGTNVTFEVNSNGAVAAQPSATSTNNGNTWTGNNSQTLTCILYPQLCLQSAGATGYGNGNLLTIWDPAFNNAFTAVTPLGAGVGQSYSQLSIKTSKIANLVNNRVDVFFPASAGTSAGFRTGFSRWDYSATVTYEDF